MNNNNNRFLETGLTLIEVVLAMGLVAVIAGFGILVYQSFQVRNDLAVVSQEVAQSLRRAQALAQASDGDAGWGVYVQNGSITLYRGTSYTNRDPNLDEFFDVPANITPSGVNEVTFAKFSGLPQTTGTIVLTSLDNETRSITINAKGTVAH